MNNFEILCSFNDRIRDAVLGGSPFGDPLQQGFVTGLSLQVFVIVYPPPTKKKKQKQKKSFFSCSLTVRSLRSMTQQLLSTCLLNQRITSRLGILMHILIVFLFWQ